MAPRERLVRRAPLKQRLAAYLDPWDWLLWISEEFNGNDWSDALKDWAIPLSAALNFIFVIARANSAGRSRDDTDLFSDGQRGNGLLVWLASFVVHLLTLLCAVNTTYTLLRKRHYRLFENSVDTIPNTPSAHRVRVDSSPITSSPLRFFSNILSISSNAESRAHPDPSRDVWEMAVWDPIPLNLQISCLFSPGHVLIYWLFLPVSPLDARPSVTIFQALFLSILLSVQLLLFKHLFTQQAKDTAIIQKEVLNEYDTKFVQPSLQKQVREVGTQFDGDTSSSRHHRRATAAEVQTYTPTIHINRTFTTNPNPNYSPHYDPDNLTAHRSPQRPSRSVTTPHFATPSVGDLSSPLRATTAIKQPQFRGAGVGASAARSRPTTATGGGDGGSFGIYSHGSSPLKKASIENMRPDLARGSSPFKGDASPLRRSVADGHARANGSAYGIGALQRRFGSGT